MNLIRLLLSNLFGIFALFVFIITFFITLPCYFIIFTFFPEKKAPHVAHRKISRLWASLLFPPFGIRLKIINEDLIQNTETYVFVANHRSLLDIPAYALSCRNTFRFLAKKELTKIPGMGWVINKLYISVDRGNKAARIRSLENMKKSLQEGISVFICPEGTRNKSNLPLLDFHDGAFRLAIDAQVPVAVLTILDSEKRLSPLHPLALSPGKITCIWDEPISTKGMSQNDIPALREKVRQTMLKRLINKD